jgi:hypothetical protein
MKSPRLAALLSFWLPGLGQAYCAAWGRALAVFGVSLLAGRAAFSGLTIGGLWACDLAPVTVCMVAATIVMLSIWIWSVWDAPRNMVRDPSDVTVRQGP